MYCKNWRDYPDFGKLIVKKTRIINEASLNESKTSHYLIKNDHCQNLGNSSDPEIVTVRQCEKLSYND